MSCSSLICQFLATFAKFWHILTTFVNFYQLLPNLTNFCQLLANFSQLFPTFPIFYNFYQLLPNFDNYYQLLPYFCQIWQLFSCHHHHIILLYCYPAILSSCQLVNLSSFHPVIMSVWKIFNLTDSEFVSLWACQLVSFIACASWSLL